MRTAVSNEPCVNDIPIVGQFVIVDGDTGRIICSCSDEYSPEIAVLAIRSVYASGDELIVEV